jgi:hypothetical protein
MTEINDEWDFYPCRVDDNPASISLNLGYWRHTPLADAPTLLWIGLQIKTPGEHGMGVAPDATLLYEIEDRISADAQARGLLYLGRLRTGGDWQLTFQGRPEHEALLDDIVAQGLAGQGRGYRTGAQPDPEWIYYRDFLFPDAERYQWMLDRRVVDQLRQQGDVLTASRPVDHHLDFPADADLAPFLEAARALGFSVEGDPTPLDDGQVSVHLQRSDALDGLQIHGVVMELTELATAIGGAYEGWGCPVVTASD